MKIDLKIKRLLNKGYSVCMSPIYQGKTCYFLVFCVLEEISLVVHGDGVILGLIVFMLFICYYLCYLCYD